jgi:phosphoribulokinase
MPDEAPLEIVTSDALGALERSQIDMQISTAKKYPRSVKAFMEEAQGMIALNQETAEACNYKLKRKEKGGGIKYIEGPSIRLLEIAASCYTNLRYG